MRVHQETLRIATSGKGTYAFTDKLEAVLRRSKLQNGQLTALCAHTSASLCIMENADASARRDLHDFFDRLVPENDPAYTHTLEGPDDATSHIRMVLTRSAETIPFAKGRLLLGTWQGIFLFEHRRSGHTRTVQVSLIGE